MLKKVPFYYKLLLFQGLVDIMNEKGYCVKTKVIKMKRILLVLAQNRYDNELSTNFFQLSFSLIK